MCPQEPKLAILPRLGFGERSVSHSVYQKWLDTKHFFFFGCRSRDSENCYFLVKHSLARYRTYSNIHPPAHNNTTQRNPNRTSHFALRTSHYTLHTTHYTPHTTHHTPHTSHTPHTHTTHHTHHKVQTVCATSFFLCVAR